MYLAIILLAAVVVVSVFLSLKRREKTKPASNRRRLRRSSRFSPSFSHQPEINTDAVLGLNEVPAKNASSREDIDPPYISLFVMAMTGEFAGYELLQALLANGLRFGKQHIFHRYADKAGESDVMFSLASATKPGTFDLQKMGSFSTPGLSLFIILTEMSDPLKAFDDMLETAYQLADDLNGALLDSKRQPLTRETISTWRKQVKHFIAHQKMNDLFEQKV